MVKKMSDSKFDYNKSYQCLYCNKDLDGINVICNDECFKKWLEKEDICDWEIANEWRLWACFWCENASGHNYKYAIPLFCEIKQRYFAQSYKCKTYFVVDSNAIRYLIAIISLDRDAKRIKSKRLTNNVKKEKKKIVLDNKEENEDEYDPMQDILKSSTLYDE
jgi:hypothetical protein